MIHGPPMNTRPPRMTRARSGNPMGGSAQWFSEAL
jgi:hypothetical protein